MIHLLLLVSTAAAAAGSVGQMFGRWQDAGAGLLPDDRGSRRPTRWLPAPGPTRLGSAPSDINSLWCSTKNGERCNPAMEAALQIQFSTEHNPLLASNFRLLVPEHLAQGDDPYNSRIQKLLVENHRDLGKHDHDPEKYDRDFNQHDRDFNKKYREFFKSDRDLSDNDRDLIFDKQPKSFYLNKKYSEYFNDRDPSDIVRDSNKFNSDVKKYPYLFKKSVNEHDSDRKQERDTSKYDNDLKHREKYRDIFIYDNDLEHDRDLSKQERDLYKINFDLAHDFPTDDFTHYGYRWITINGDIDRDDDPDVDIRDVLNDQNAKHDQKNRLIRINLHGSKINDNGNIKIKNDVYGDQVFKLHDNNVLNYQKANLLDQNNRMAEINLYGLKLDNDNGNTKINDDVTFVDDIKGYKWPDHDHNVKLVEQDSHVIDDIKLDDDEFVIVDEESPRYEVFSDGPFSEIPSSEFTQDLEHWPSVKKDLSSGIPWIDSACQSLENNGDDREHSQVDALHAPCGVCCALHRQLAKLAQPLPDKPSSEFVDLMRPAHEPGPENVLAGISLKDSVAGPAPSSDFIPEGLQTMLGQLLASRRDDIHVINSDHHNKDNGALVV